MECRASDRGSPGRINFILVGTANLLQVFHMTKKTLIIFSQNIRIWLENNFNSLRFKVGRQIKLSLSYQIHTNQHIAVRMREIIYDACKEDDKFPIERER